MNIDIIRNQRLGGFFHAFLHRSLFHCNFFRRTCVHYGIIMVLVCLSPGMLAQVADGEVTEETAADGTTNTEESEAFDFPVSPRESHSRRDASSELLERVALEPQTFVGKSITLDDGEPVGEVLAVKRKLDNLHLYFIVDASVYFNVPTTYAIPVREVESVEGDIIVMELDQDMHVQGLTYYPDDYTVVENNFPKQALPATGN